MSKIDHLKSDAVKEADRQVTLIWALTRAIAQAMGLIHGGEWRVCIDHEVGFITIVPRSEKSK